MKLALKRTANAIALAIVALPWLLYQLESRIMGRQKTFAGWSQAISLIPGTAGAYLRRAFYRLTLAQCGDDAWISFGTVFSHSTARVGNNVYIGVFCAIGDVTLEDDALVSSHVSICNGAAQHGIERLDIPVREQPGTFPRVTIGRDTWIGERAVVLVDVGKHCVIGAGSVVTREIPEYAIAVGSPARVIRSRLSAELVDALS